MSIRSNIDNINTTTNNLTLDSIYYDIFKTNENSLKEFMSKETKQVN